MNALRHICLLLTVCLLSAATGAAQRRNSTSRQLKVAHTGISAPEAMADTVAATGTMVRFVGYDKALRSNKETVFVTNLMTGRDIMHVVFHITYLDMQGRQLHKARKSLYAPVPAGETRRLDFPSWDRQHSFFYAGSPRPRVAAIPYTVRITPDTLVLAR